MRPSAIASAAVLPAGAVLALVLLLAPPDGGEPAGTDSPGEGARGPVVVIEESLFREVRPDGRITRMRFDRATYAVVARTVDARGVTLGVPSPSGEVEVAAPRAFWDTDKGRIDLPDGGEAESAQGWRAEVAASELDLSGRVLSAGRAVVRGPGIVFEGENLVWRWEDGTVALDRPKGRVEPAAAGRP